MIEKANASLSPIMFSVASYQFTLIFHGFGYGPNINEYLMVLVSKIKFDSCTCLDVFPFTTNSCVELDGDNFSSYCYCSVVVEKKM